MSLFLRFLIFIFVCNAYANVEKVIFLAPETVPVLQDASIDNLLLFPLSPTNSTVRTKLNATFPTKDQPRGTESWLLLENLVSSTRYEVRICWLATQPTAFSLYTYTLTEAFEDPALITSLSTFAYAQHATLNKQDIENIQALRARSREASSTLSSSMLFLQIFAAADYFSTNHTLMEKVPPVMVDIILDPYLLNIFPRSLLPTAGYLLIIAGGSWFVSGFVWKSIVRYVKATSVEGRLSEKKIK